MLIAGCDFPGEGEVAAGADAAAVSPSLYWMDYLGACRKVPFGAHGYCGYFIMSTFDRYYREGLSVDDALEICRKCIAEIKERFMVDVGVRTASLRCAAPRLQPRRSSSARQRLDRSEPRSRSRSRLLD